MWDIVYVYYYNLKLSVRPHFVIICPSTASDWTIGVCTGWIWGTGHPVQMSSAGQLESMMSQPRDRVQPPFCVGFALAGEWKKGVKSGSPGRYDLFVPRATATIAPAPSKGFSDISISENFIRMANTCTQKWTQKSPPPLTRNCSCYRQCGKGAHKIFYFNEQYTRSSIHTMYSIYIYIRRPLFFRSFITHAYSTSLFVIFRFLVMMYIYIHYKGNSQSIDFARLYTHDTYIRVCIIR